MKPIVKHKLSYSTHIFSIFMLTILFFICSSCLKPEADNPSSGQNPTPTTSFDWLAIADSSTTSLNQRFWNGQKFYNNASPSDNQFNYWPQAHALDVLVDAYVRTGNTFFITYMNDWMVGVKIKNGNTFLNHFYDDMEWNALAMLRAYKVTNDVKWLTESITLWNDIKNGWNDTMGGGIAWNKSQTSYKNTPANAPACILAARLYRETNNADYLMWAQKIYDWQKATLVNPPTGLVYDGINRNNDGKLDTDPSWNFAYNQGTYIGAALELYASTNNINYLDDAIRTADTFLADPFLSPGGIMRNSDNGDGGLFNGIGVRYLVLLIQQPSLPSGKKTNYVNYLKKNAETLWSKGTNKLTVNFGTNWSSTPGASGFLNPNLSGCMLMEAMALLKSKDYLK
jgi:predicted alpha-1,6-mannanase (GH76 family)